MTTTNDGTTDTNEYVMIDGTILTMTEIHDRIVTELYETCKDRQYAITSGIMLDTIKWYARLNPASITAQWYLLYLNTHYKTTRPNDLNAKLRTVLGR